MKFLSSVASLSVLAAMAAVADASTISLIGGALGSGNGDLRSDPAGVAAPAAVALNTAVSLNQNGNGRALIASGASPGGGASDLSTILDNPGVSIEGFSVFRRFYQGGNNGLGFLENGGRLGVANMAFDGQAFANSSDYFLVSDAIAVAGANGDTYDFSVVAGHDIGNGFDLEVFLLFDDGAGVSIADLDGLSGPVQTLTGSAVATAAHSTVRIVFEVDAQQSPSTRVNLDNIRLNVTPVPEPGAALIALMGLTFVGAAGMRRRLG